MSAGLSTAPTFEPNIVIRGYGRYQQQPSPLTVTAFGAFFSAPVGTVSFVIFTGNTGLFSGTIPPVRMVTSF